ncbi:butyrophilin subfamily 3 member A2 [Lates calcarifer]|uniref:Butyrophilin subfamily 3 member A2 n=1 Tax=Lates calcarifer TaxID=8187 RepID=A0A4W6BX99_LATCA|nr:butyrophilin subfamily 3 member A2 [Lates calcarifer]
MLQLKNEQPLKPQPRAFRALVFHHAVFFLLLTHHCGGQPQMVSPSQPIVAVVGDDVILPCHLEPAMDASDMTVEWTRPDLEPRFVHVWRSGVELENKKHPSYMGRTSLSPNRLKHGDISLTLPRVKLSDEGTYKCFIPTISRESTVDFVVGAVSSLNISLARPENEEETSAVVLECESKGWYPEPEVLWLDGEGNLLSAGPTETVRGLDDLYTVSSRVTVEKRHSNSFTCRVQQNKTNQTRETEIHVPDDFFSAPCSSATQTWIIISLALAFAVIVAVVFVVWRWRQTGNSNKLKPSTTGSLINYTELHTLVDEKGEAVQATTESVEVKDLDKKEENLKVQLNEVEEERRDVVGAVNFLMDHRKDLQDQIYQLGLLLHDVEVQRDEVQSQWREKLNENEHLQTDTEHETVKKDLERKRKDKDAVLKSVICAVNIVTEKKKALDDCKEQINGQLEEIENQRLQSDHSET